MSKISIEFDTETKECNFSVDGAIIDALDCNVGYCKYTSYNGKTDKTIRVCYSTIDSDGNISTKSIMSDKEGVRKSDSMISYSKEIEKIISNHIASDKLKSILLK